MISGSIHMDVALAMDVLELSAQAQKPLLEELRGEVTVVVIVVLPLQLRLPHHERILYKATNNSIVVPFDDSCTYNAIAEQKTQSKSQNMCTSK